jgi:hypothetical protein
MDKFKVFKHKAKGTDDRAPVPIDYGAKLTGRIGRYNVGFLQVQTRKLGEASTGLGTFLVGAHADRGSRKTSRPCPYKAGGSVLPLNSFVTVL